MSLATCEHVLAPVGSYDLGEVRFVLLCQRRGPFSYAPCSADIRSGGHTFDKCLSGRTTGSVTCSSASTGSSRRCGAAASVKVVYRLSASSSLEGQFVVWVGGTSSAGWVAGFGRWIGWVGSSQGVRGAPVAPVFVAIVP